MATDTNLHFFFNFFYIVFSYINVGSQELGISWCLIISCLGQMKIEGSRSHLPGEIKTLVLNPCCLEVISKHIKVYGRKSRHKSQRWLTAKSCNQASPKCNTLYSFRSRQYGREETILSGKHTTFVYYHPDLHPRQVTPILPERTEF